FPDKAERVTGVINSLPAAVITTCTSAPSFTNKRKNIAALYAAMLPVIPNIIFLPSSLMGVEFKLLTCSPCLGFCGKFHFPLILQKQLRMVLAFFRKISKFQFARGFQIFLPDYRCKKQTPEVFDLILLLIPMKSGWLFLPKSSQFHKCCLFPE